MENAAKALSMAGGILIAVLIIGVLVYMFNSSRGMFVEKADSELVEQVATFNKEFESYNKKLLRGVEVASVCNKAESNNIKYEDEPTYQIEIYFEMVDEIQYEMESKPGQLTTYKLEKGKLYNMSELLKLRNSAPTAFTEFKRRVFNCVGVKTNQTGRICEMTFKEQNVDGTGT